MATQSQLSTVAPANGLAELKAEAALAQASSNPVGNGVLSINPLVARLPVEIDVSVPVRGFRIRNLLALSTGSVIASTWINGDDMPLRARGAQLAWTEFEVIDQLLAVRITRLV